jgi:hypothetical protein
MPSRSCKTRKNAPAVPPSSDFTRLKTIAHQLLLRLEEAVSCKVTKDETQWQRQHDRLFGAKHSITSALAALADLLLKLEQAEEKNDGQGGQPIEIGAGDIALIKSFLERTKGAAS